MSINRNRNGNTFNRSTGKCARCGKTGELRARRLDATCYQASRLDGTINDYPLTRRPFTDTLEEYKFLKETGETHERIAQRLGLTPESLRVALWKASRPAPAVAA